MADEVIVIMTPEPTAFADAYAMVKLVSLQKPEMKVGIIVNIARNEEDGERIFSKFSEIVKRFLERSIMYRGTILRDTAVSEAVIRQVPLVLSSGSTPSIQSIRKIAKNLLGIKSANKRTLYNR